MSRVEISAGEPFERALRRFKKKIEREGVIKILKARKHYEKPSERRRRKAREARSNRMRKY